LEGGKSGAWWAVTKIFFRAEFDLAFLFLVPMSESAANYNWRLPGVNLFPPAIGSRVAAFGYRSGDIQTEVDHDKKEITVIWKHSPTTTTGTVREIHEQRRDDSMLNFPCYRVNARFAPGMSGGPVFDDNGHLCGLIAASMKSLDESQENYSYVSTLWPSMGIPLNVDRQGKPRGNYYAIELARDGFIRAIGWKRITIVLDNQGHQTGTAVRDIG